MSSPSFANHLEALKAGNLRFTHTQAYERKKLIAAQAPFCAVVACSDSRVAPEIIFDQRLGDLFVVRIAGNVASFGTVESLHFATYVLKVSLIVVMGHQHCGAVQAVMTHQGEEDLGTIASLIQPAVAGKKTLKESVIANVHAQVKILQEHELLKEKVAAGTLKIFGAYYDFNSGLVEFFETPHNAP